MEPTPAWDGGGSSRAEVGRGARPGLRPAPARGPRAGSPRPTAPSSAGRDPGIGQAPLGTATGARPTWSIRHRSALGLALRLLPARPSLFSSRTAARRNGNAPATCWPFLPGARHLGPTRRMERGAGRLSEDDQARGGRAAWAGSWLPRSAQPLPARRTRDGAESSSPSSAIAPAWSPKPPPPPPPRPPAPSEAYLPSATTVCPQIWRPSMGT